MLLNSMGVIPRSQHEEELAVVLELQDELPDEWQDDGRIAWASRRSET